MKPLSLFDGVGIELEYMIVDARTRAVMPVADRVLRNGHTDYPSEVERGAMAWSNELALHVLELKTKGPARQLEEVPNWVLQDVRQINQQLEEWGGCLMPTAMHPWMDPRLETRLWPHDYQPVYEAFNRIFGCQGHGWSNLQSLHLNLPFANDLEFARLHAAIRLVLPLLPALAASSPLQDGVATGYLDNRLNVYRTNCARIPSITGHVIPEPVFSKRAYQAQILQRMYRDIAPLDPEGLLQEEWLNARGAIARFERNTIEIRVLDTQETPQADVAIAAAVVGLLRALVAERWVDLATQQSFSTESLEAILLETIRNADRAIVTEEPYRRAFGLNGKPCSATDLWAHILQETLPWTAEGDGSWHQTLAVILKKGCLSRRVLKAVGTQPTLQRLRSVYGDLCHCLATGSLFVA